MLRHSRHTAVLSVVTVLGAILLGWVGCSLTGGIGSIEVPVGLPSISAATAGEVDGYVYLPPRSVRAAVRQQGCDSPVVTDSPAPPATCPDYVPYEGASVTLTGDNLTEQSDVAGYFRFYVDAVGQGFIIRVGFPTDETDYEDFEATVVSQPTRFIKKRVDLANSSAFQSFVERAGTRNITAATMSLKVTNNGAQNAAVYVWVSRNTALTETTIAGAADAIDVFANQPVNVPAGDAIALTSQAASSTTLAALFNSLKSAPAADRALAIYVLVGTAGADLELSDVKVTLVVPLLG